MTCKVCKFEYTITGLCIFYVAFIYYTAKLRRRGKLLLIELEILSFFMSDFFLFTDICKLRLTKLDVSGNRISHLPCEYRRMDTVEEFRLDHNPLVCPPAHVSTSLNDGACNTSNKILFLISGESSLQIKMTGARFTKRVRAHILHISS